MTSLAVSEEQLFIVRVANGWAIYYRAPYDIANDRPGKPCLVARTAREMAGYIQGWAEAQQERSEPA